MLVKSHKLSGFIRYNIVALLATSVDFLVLIFFTEILHFWYLFSAVIGTLLGGIVAFILERNWTFIKKEDEIKSQAIRYAIVWCISLLLNTTLLFICVEFLEIQYVLSRVIVAVLISISFNFFSHKYYIFK